MTGSPGLTDPCEKEATDVTDCLTSQQKEEVTASAQVCNCNSNIHNSVYGAVILALHCYCESSPSSSDECSMQRQVAADLWTKPISLSQ